MNRGRFITLEGGEGVGKSTQARRLGEALEARGLSVLTTREPGGSPGAEAIRELLLHSPADAWTPRAEALLFAAARSDHVTRTIAPALAAGRWVICDRFVDSTRAYQGGEGGLSDARIMALHDVGCEGLMPDRTLLLSLEAAASRARIAGRGSDRYDRFEDRRDDFHARVRAGFEGIAAAEPARVRRIDADGDEQAVTARLLAALDDLLPCPA